VLLLHAISLFQFFWASPDRSILIGFAGQGIWLWSAETGDFSYHTRAINYLGFRPGLKAFFPEYDHTARYVVTTASGTQALIRNGTMLWIPVYPMTIVALVCLAVLTLRMMAARSTESKVRGGHCRACGYQMKGCPSSICPECGHDENGSVSSNGTG
jgi:hypothetical protein